jgi:hypothetical protein
MAFTEPNSSDSFLLSFKTYTLIRYIVLRCIFLWEFLGDRSYKFFTGVLGRRQLQMIQNFKELSIYAKNMNGISSGNAM